MEALLAPSFDYLSSYDQGKIRKGLRQVEGLLAQICLSRSKLSSSGEAAGPGGDAAAAGGGGERRHSVSATTAEDQKSLDELAEDPAFAEFFKLQEGFQWNGENFYLFISR